MQRLIQDLLNVAQSEAGTSVDRGSAAGRMALVAETAETLGR